MRTDARRLQDKLYKREYRAKKRAKVAYLRPRCVVCDKPIEWGKPGVRYDSRTCGGYLCPEKAIKWFGPMKARASRRGSSPRRTRSLPRSEPLSA